MLASVQDEVPRPHEGPRVVVIGAGFAGLEAARELGRAGVATTIVDRRNHHLFQPLLYQVATAALSPADIAEPIRKVLSPYPSIDVVFGEVAGFDVAAKQVTLESGSTIPYDRLIVATGATHSYFGHDEWAAVAPGLKTIEDARKIRSRLLLAFEQAEAATDPIEQRRLMTAVVIGGGPTGVELAGAIAELARYALAKDFRRIRPETATVILVEAGPRLLSAFPVSLSSYAERRLKRLGVTVRLGQAVDEVTATGVSIAGDFVQAGTVVWAAGVAASPAGRWIGAETDRAGRVVVAPDLSVPGLPHVYVIGDLSSARGADGKPLPGTAQVAKQQGQHLGPALAANILRHEPLPPFHFNNRGDAAIIGRHSAVFDFGRRHLTGWPAWILWAIVHVYLLVGFQHRLAVSLQWLWAYLTYERGARLISEVLVPAGSALHAPLAGHASDGGSAAKQGQRAP